MPCHKEEQLMRLLLVCPKQGHAAHPEWEQQKRGRKPFMLTVFTPPQSPRLGFKT